MQGWAASAGCKVLQHKHAEGSAVGCGCHCAYLPAWPCCKAVPWIGWPVSSRCRCAAAAAARPHMPPAHSQPAANAPPELLAVSNNPIVCLNQPAMSPRGLPLLLALALLAACRPAAAVISECPAALLGRPGVGRRHNHRGAVWTRLDLARSVLHTFCLMQCSALCCTASSPPRPDSSRHRLPPPLPPLAEVALHHPAAPPACSVECVLPEMDARLAGGHDRPDLHVRRRRQQLHSHVQVERKRWVL